VDAALSHFTDFIDGRYQVYIANPLQGRGIDFPTSQPIEKNGGVYVLIAQLPE